MPSDLERASGLPLASFRREHVAEQLARAYRREAVADETALARALRADGEARKRFRRGRDLTRVDVPRSRAVRVAGARAAAPAAGRRRARVGLVGGLLGRF